MSLFSKENKAWIIVPETFQSDHMKHMLHFFFSICIV